MDLKKKRPLIIGGITVAVLGGYFVAGHFASQAAERELRRTLIDLGLDRAVRYRDVSASVLGGSVTLRQVELRDTEGRGVPVTIEDLRVSDYSADRGVLKSITIEADGLSVPLLESAREAAVNRGNAGLAIMLNGGPFSVSGFDMLSLGYTTLNGAAALSVKFSPDDRKASVKASVDFDDAYAAQASVSLEGVDQRVPEAISDIASSIGREGDGLAQLGELFANGARLADAVSRVELADLQIGFKDKGIRLREMANESEGALFFDGAKDYARLKARDARKQIEDDLFRRKVETRMAGEIADRLSAFVADGGSISLSTNIDRPLPIFQASRASIVGFEPTPTFSDLDRFLSGTGARVER